MDTKFLNVKYKKLHYFFFSVTSRDQKPQIEAKTCGEMEETLFPYRITFCIKKVGIFIYL